MPRYCGFCLIILIFAALQCKSSLSLTEQDFFKNFSVQPMKSKNLFQLLLSVMLIVGTTGCYDDDEIKDAEKYTFQGIRYAFEEEGDGLSFYDVEYNPLIVKNNSSETITASYEPYKDTWIESTFRSDDPEAFTWMGEEEIRVSTPNITGNSVYPGGAEKKYCSETEKTESTNSNITTTGVPPHHKLIMNGTIHYSKLVTTYTLTFVGEYTKTIKEIKGKYIRTAPESHTVKINLVEI